MDIEGTLINYGAEHRQGGEPNRVSHLRGERDVYTGETQRDRWGGEVKAWKKGQPSGKYQHALPK